MRYSEIGTMGFSIVIIAACSSGHGKGSDATLAAAAPVAHADEPAAAAAATAAAPAQGLGDTATAVATGSTCVAANAGAGKVTFQTDIQPIIKAHCATCHSGSQAPNMSGGNVSAADRAGVATQVASGNMPVGSTLDQATKAKIAAWADAGYPDDGTAAAVVGTASGCGAGSAGPATLQHAPSDYADLVALVNAQPMPLTISAFIKALKRPYAVTATYSEGSLQPSCDADNPRMFISYGKLIMALSPTGTLTNQLEIALPLNDTKQIMANLTFPLNGPITEEQLYQGVLDAKAKGTACTGQGLCHVNEAPFGMVGKTPVFTSNFVTPIPFDYVSLQQLLGLNSKCTDSTDRCKMFNALLSAPAPSEYVWTFGEFTSTSTDFFTKLPITLSNLGDDGIYGAIPGGSSVAPNAIKSACPVAGQAVAGAAGSGT